MFEKSKRNIIMTLICSTIILGNNVYAEMPDRSEDSKQLSSITPRFCNNNTITKDLDLGSINTDEDIDICVWVLNSNEESVKIKMYFTDSVEPSINNDKYTCVLEEDEQAAFGKYAKFINNNGEASSKLTYEIKQDETLFSEAKFKLPSSYQEKLVWCLVTEIDWFEEVEGYLNVKLRRANLVTMYPNGEIKIAFDVSPGEVKTSSKWQNSNNFLASILGSFNQEELALSDSDIISYNDQIVIKKDKKTGTFSAQIKAKNDGWLPLEVIVESKITNIFGFEKELVSEEVINVQEDRLIKFDIKEIPFYGGNYKLSLKVKSEPIIDEEIKDKITKEQEKIEEESYELDFYIFPIGFVFWLVITVLIAVFIVTIAQQRKKK